MNDNIAVFTVYEDKYILVHITGQKAEHIYVYDSLAADDTGNIINCRVESNIDNIDASFVRYASKKYGFINKRIRNGSIMPLMLKKEAYREKQALFTDRITIDGEYVVVTYGAKHIKASSKAGEEARKEYTKIFSDLIGNDRYGIIIRTKAFTDTDGLEKAKEEYILIKAKLCGITEKSGHTPQYTVLYRALPGFIKDLIYLTDQGIEKIVTDRQEIKEVLEQSYDHVSKAVNVTDRVGLKMYDDSLLPLTACYGLKAKISEALSRKVYLKSGAYITIDETEALTSVDVNSAGCVFNSDDTDKTFFRINCEAAAEIARQMILRNISGMIIIDFINMKTEEDYLKLEEEIKKCLYKDREYAKFIDFTGLRLAEITRPRKGRTLYQNLRRQL
ncbi:MAG: ribonuclease E/G [Lachnospiraceae bacterium]|nr:ribonuclease E/G [Lachnospiraceae bacterium]